MLYLAAAKEIPLHNSTHLSVEHVDPSREGVARCFTLPYVRYVASHTGCSCGFPMIESQQPAEYFGKFFRHAFENGAGLQSGRLLLDFLRALVRSNGEVQLYPVWDLQEHAAPKGTIDVFLDGLEAESLSLKEQYLHRVKDKEAGL